MNRGLFQGGITNALLLTGGVVLLTLLSLVVFHTPKAGASNRLRGVATGALASAMVRSSSRGTGYDLSWYTVDGGGVMFSTGDDYELSGTIGQPDAGGPMTADDFELTGGFWFAIAPGDCNADGGVNLIDYDAFADCVSGPDGGPLSPECACFDLDDDDDVDLEDFGAFQRRFSGS